MLSFAILLILMEIKNIRHFLLLKAISMSFFNQNNFAELHVLPTKEFFFNTWPGQTLVASLPVSQISSQVFFLQGKLLLFNFIYFYFYSAKFDLRQGTLSLNHIKLRQKMPKNSKYF